MQRPILPKPLMAILMAMGALLEGTHKVLGAGPRSRPRKSAARTGQREAGLRPAHAGLAAGFGGEAVAVVAGRRRQRFARVHVRLAADIGTDHFAVLARDVAK